MSRGGSRAECPSLPEPALFGLCLPSPSTLVDDFLCRLLLLSPENDRSSSGLEHLLFELLASRSVASLVTDGLGLCESPSSALFALSAAAAAAARARCPAGVPGDLGVLGVESSGISSASSTLTPSPNLSAKPLREARPERCDDFSGRVKVGV